MFLNEFPLDRTHTRSLVDAFRMRQQPNGTLKRCAYLGCITATPTGNGAQPGSHWPYRLRGTIIQVMVSYCRGGVPTAREVAIVSDTAATEALGRGDTAAASEHRLSASRF